MVQESRWSAPDRPYQRMRLMAPSRGSCGRAAENGRGRATARHVNARGCDAFLSARTVGTDNLADDSDESQISRQPGGTSSRRRAFS